MAETINMPKLGFDMAEGTLVRWVKKVGETINKGDVLAEIETDKATVEVESSASGVVRKLLVDEGAVVPVNSPIAIVGTADEVIEEAGQCRKQESSRRKVESQPRSSGQPDQLSALSSLHPDLQSAIPIPNLQSCKASPLAKKIAREAQRGSEPACKAAARAGGSCAGISKQRMQRSAGQQVSGQAPGTVQRPSPAADETVSYEQTPPGHCPADGRIQDQHPAFLCDAMNIKWMR